jgi:hypothetical protein
MSKNLIALYSGSGIGLLIGVLMGLAVSPTVGVIIGALSSALAVLLGLNDKHFGVAKAIRIGSFGFACVLGAFLGIFVRTNNLLSPGIEELKESYTKIGYTDKQALDFIAFKEFGILDEKWKMAGGTAKSSGDDQGKVASTENLAQLQHASVLFAAEVDLSACDELESTDASLPVKEIVNNFKLVGGFWANLAGAVEKDIDPKYQGKVLLATREVLCANQTKKIDDTDCAKLANLNKSSSLADIKSGFIKVGGIWKQLLDKMDNLNMNADLEKTSLLILRDCLCEQETK